MISATILGNVPSKSNCYKIITLPGGRNGMGRASLAKTKIVKQYEKAFALQVPAAAKKGIEIPVKISLAIYFHSRRQDIDSPCKTILDCIQNNGIIKNDRQVHELHVLKKLDRKNPRVEIKIEPYQEALELWENQ